VEYQDYIASLQWIELKAPSHPLLPALRSGHTRMYELYMQQVLKTIPTPSAPASRSENNPQLAILYKEKKTLYGSRAKLSNQFHACNTNAERTRVSIDIQLIQDQIERVRRRINHYEQHGELPKDENGEEIQKTGVELMKQLNSVRARISQCKRQIESIAGLPADHEDRDKIAHYEKRLKELEKEKLHVEAAVAKESV